MNDDKGRIRTGGRVMTDDFECKNCKFYEGGLCTKEPKMKGMRFAQVYIMWCDNKEDRESD